VRCGAWVATVLGLAAASVRQGGTVAPGTRIGTAAGTRVHLGARRRSRRHGYVDPLELLEARDDVPPGLGPAPAPGGGGERRLRPLPAVRPLPRTGPATGPARAPGAGVPLAGWVGLVVAAAGVPLGTVRRRRARARRGGLAAQVAR
jgi:hypothetical protein